MTNWKPPVSSKYNYKKMRRTRRLIDQGFLILESKPILARMAQKRLSSEIIANAVGVFKGTVIAAMSDNTVTFVTGLRICNYLGLNLADNLNIRTFKF